MARVTDQAVPPSLADRFSEIWAMVECRESDALDTRLKYVPDGRSLYQPDSHLGKLAMETGAWFRSNWTSQVPANDLSSFYASRKADIFTGSFPSDFWTLCSPTQDYTERCYPSEVMLYNKPLNPLYYDANRLPSYSISDKILSSYATPARPGTEQQPSPGWKGVVLSGMWRDLYLAQRRYRFTLPSIQTKYETRPTVLVISATIEATASFRGVSSWFQVQTMPFFFRFSPYGNTPPVRVCSAWEQEFIQPQDIPPADPFGWAYSYDTDIIRSAHANAEYQKGADCDRLWVRIASPPSRGLFFGRNDAVQVWCNAAAHLYVARDAHA